MHNSQESYRLTIRLADITPAEVLRTIAKENGWSLGEAFEHVLDCWRAIQDSIVDDEEDAASQLEMSDEIMAWVELSRPHFQYLQRYLDAVQNQS